MRPLSRGTASGPGSSPRPSSPAGQTARSWRRRATAPLKCSPATPARPGLGKGLFRCSRDQRAAHRLSSERLTVFEDDLAYLLPVLVPSGPGALLLSILVGALGFLL